MLSASLNNTFPSFLPYKDSITKFIKLRSETTTATKIILKIHKKTKKTSKTNKTKQKQRPPVKTTPLQNVPHQLIHDNRSQRDLVQLHYTGAVRETNYYSGGHCLVQACNKHDDLEIGNSCRDVYELTKYELTYAVLNTIASYSHHCRYVHTFFFRFCKYSY